MCKIDAVSSRNCAIAINAPLAMSCSGDSNIDATPNAHAAVKDADANVFSKAVVIKKDAAVAEPWPQGYLRFFSLFRLGVFSSVVPRPSGSCFFS